MKISVIICTYNRPHLIKRAIDSVIDQSYENFEIIVVDDNSQKVNKSRLKNTLAKYKDKVIPIYLDINKGVSHASNVGFSRSNGDYIALLGDDDYWIDRHKITKQLDIFMNDSSSNVGLVGSFWVERNGDFEINKCPKEPRNWKEKLLSGGGVICGSTALISKEAWNEVGGFDELITKGTDSDLFRRIVLRGYRGVILKEITTVVDVGHGLTRMTPNNLETFQSNLLNQTYLLRKYFLVYLRYPTAFYSRIRRIAFLWLKSRLFY